MSVFTEPQDNPDPNRAALTLLDYLSNLFGQEKAPRIPSSRVADDSTQDRLDWLVATGKEFGLRVERVALAPSAAAETSAEQSPLVGLLHDGSGWLVLHGFRSGRVKAAVARGALVEAHLLKPAAVAEMLGLPEDHPADWLLVQPQAPFAQAASADGHHTDMPPMRRLIEMMRPESADLGLLLGLAVGSGLLALAPPVAVQALVNTVAMGGMGQTLAVLSIILLGFLVFSGAVHVLESYLVELVQRRIFVRLAADMAYRLPKVRCEVYDSQHGGELVNRFFDVLTVQKASSSLLLDGLSLLMQAAVGLILLAFYHPFLLAFDIVLLVSIGFIMFVLGRGAVPSAVEESMAKYALVAWLEIIARNLWTFKSDGGPRWAVERTDTLAHAYLAAKRAHYRVVLRQIIGSVSLYAVATTSLLAIGGYLVINRQLTLGQLVAAELIVSTVLASLIKFGKQLEGFYDLMAGVNKIGHLLDLPLEREHGATPAKTGPATLAVRGLSFGYGARRPVLAGVDFAIQAGERVAVLGGHGSGKSTLAQLVCGLRQPDGGSIEFDGIAIGNLRLDALRTRISVVGTAEIIEDSLFENVRLGRPGMGVDTVERALASVGLTDEGAGLPTLTVDMLVGPNGSPLSTVQTRLLSIARAIAGSPALLVLDCVLDDLDEASRRRVATALIAAHAPWTLLVLTRSPSVAALCGRVVELPVRGQAVGAERATDYGGGGDFRHG
jgi:putative ABC transport system ATP-binding protein